MMFKLSFMQTYALISTGQIRVRRRALAWHPQYSVSCHNHNKLLLQSFYFCLLVREIAYMKFANFIESFRSMLAKQKVQRFKSSGKWYPDCTI